MDNAKVIQFQKSVYFLEKFMYLVCLSIKFSMLYFLHCRSSSFVSLFNDVLCRIMSSNVSLVFFATVASYSPFVKIYVVLSYLLYIFSNIIGQKQHLEDPVYLICGDERDCDKYGKHILFFFSFLFACVFVLINGSKFFVLNNLSL